MDNGAGLTPNPVSKEAHGWLYDAIVQKRGVIMSATDEPVSELMYECPLDGLLYRVTLQVVEG
jgi:hypothetical protein